MTFLWIYCPDMAKIDHASQPELPIAQQISCRRCKGVGTVYYARMRAEIIGGKRITCPECKFTEGSILQSSYFDTSSHLITKKGQEGGGGSSAIP